MLLDVASDCISLDVADAPAKLARAPKLPLPENQPEVWEGRKQLVRRPTFETLRSKGSETKRRMWSTATYMLWMRILLAWRS